MCAPRCPGTRGSRGDSGYSANDVCVCVCGERKVDILIYREGICACVSACVRVCVFAGASVSVSMSVGVSVRD